MDLSSLTPLAGGPSGQTFLGEVAGERCTVRIYAEPGDRGDAAAEIDASLMRLVRGLVPVPEVLEVRRPDPRRGVPGLLVTSFVEGVRGDLLLSGLDEDGLTRAGSSFGTVAAVLAGMPQLRPGPFADGDLTVGAWPDQQDREIPPRCALTHGDLDPYHLLVDPDTLEVRTVTGWGRAHTGDPLADLGSAARPRGSPRGWPCPEPDDGWGPGRRMDDDRPGAYSGQLRHQACPPDMEWIWARYASIGSETGLLCVPFRHLTTKDSLPL